MSMPLSHDALRSIGLTDALLQRALAAGGSPERLARVSERHRDRYVLHDGRRELAAFTSPSAEPPLVGDWVLVQPPAMRNEAAPLAIEGVVERSNQLSRLRGDGSLQPMVANVDTTLLVMGLDGNFNLRRLERFIALATAAQTTPVIVLTKADTVANTAERVEAAREYFGSRLPIVYGDARDAALVQALGPWTGHGSTLVLLGSSGVGKSTLTNALMGHALQKTGDVSGAADRGRHTTVARRLLPLPSGACIIDMPGLREVGLTGDEPLQSVLFEDIAQRAISCHYRDCKHEQEPGCAVREAVDPEYLAYYRKLLQEQAQALASPSQRREQRTSDKQHQKATRRSYRDRDDEG